MVEIWFIGFVVWVFGAVLLLIFNEEANELASKVKMNFLVFAVVITGISWCISLLFLIYISTEVLIQRRRDA